MIRLVLALLLLAGPVHATQDQWPALFDVRGVASNDVLNIRAAPSGGAAIVGTLSPDARDIEVIRPNERGTWGLVNTGESTGWVSLRFLDRQPGQWDGQFPAIRACFGTEPFWTLRREADGQILFGSPETTQTGSVIRRISSDNRRDRHAMSIRFDNGPWQDAVGVVTLNRCSDGMSDLAYGITLDLLLVGAASQRLVSGCCSLSP